MATEAAPKKFGGFQIAGTNETVEPKAIVPLLRHEEDGLSVVGTAFYISHAGLLVTAKHCIVDQRGEVDPDKPASILHWSTEHENQFLHRPILRGWFSPVADVAVLVAAPMHNRDGHPLPVQSVSLSIERPPPGTDVAAYAYPDTKVTKEDEKTAVHVSPTLVEGVLLDYFPHGRDRAMIHWPVYETNMIIQSGCSGGPVFSEKGTVFAVVTSSFEGIESDGPVSYITPIDYILDAVISNVKIGEEASPQEFTIRELAQQGQIEFNPPFPVRKLS
jgi:S1-C subfamily serine protease